jgi:hypothetical protein
MSEQIFFNQGNVKVTNARFIVNSQTYAMSGVTSVKTGFAPPNRNGAFGAIIVGVLIALGGDGATKLFGVLMAAAGIWYLTQLKNTHSVYLSSASGEVQALSDTDETYIGNVVEALNEALIHRG